MNTAPGNGHSEGAINYTSMQKVNDVEAKMAKALDKLKRLISACLGLGHVSLALALRLQ